MLREKEIEEDASLKLTHSPTKVRTRWSSNRCPNAGVSSLNLPASENAFSPENYYTYNLPDLGERLITVNLYF